MNKNIMAVALVVILVAAAASVVYLLKSQSTSETSGTEQKQNEEEVVKTDLLFGEPLPGFPSDLPMQNGNKIIRNYKVENPDGRIQATRQFSTSLSVDAALTLYTNFFESKGWLRVKDGALTSPVSMQHGSDRLMMTAREDQSDNSVTVVEISLTQAAK